MLDRNNKKEERKDVGGDGGKRKDHVQYKFT